MMTLPRVAFSGLCALQPRGNTRANIFRCFCVPVGPVEEDTVSVVVPWPWGPWTLDLGPMAQHAATDRDGVAA